MDMGKVYDVVKKEFKDKFDILVLKQTGFNNTHTIATTPELAQQYGLEKISDLTGKEPGSWQRPCHADHP